MRRIPTDGQGVRVMKFTLSIPTWKGLQNRTGATVSHVRLEREIRDLQE